MKAQTTTKIAKVALILGGSTCMFISSCAMSEGRAEKIGQGAGTVAGGVAGGIIAEKYGRGIGDTIFGTAAGAAAGNAFGGWAGRESSTLKGLENTNTR